MTISGLNKKEMFGVLRLTFKNQCKYLNIKHKNMKFSIETEINKSLFFLDVKIFPEKDKFVTSAFRKNTFSGTYEFDKYT